MSRLTEAVDQVNQGFESYNFTQATTAAYNFWLYELCDVYLEVVKPIMMGDNEQEKELTKQVKQTPFESTFNYTPNASLRKQKLLIILNLDPLHLLGDSTPYVQSVHAVPHRGAIPETASP